MLIRFLEPLPRANRHYQPGDTETVSSGIGASLVRQGVAEEIVNPSVLEEIDKEPAGELIGGFVDDADNSTPGSSQGDETPGRSKSSRKRGGAEA